MSLLIAAAAMTALGLAVLAWLRPTLPPEFAKPVVGYVVVIGAMVATSFGSVAAGASVWIPIGAVLFAVSDVSVARDRFVDPGFVNGAWGLPTYFLAQVILALTAGLALA